MKYGDAVIVIQKSVDGTVTRKNAIVLASALQHPLRGDRVAIEGADVEEHLDVAIPVLSLAPEGQVLKTRNMDEIFRPAYGVRPFTGELGIGWELSVTEEVEKANAVDEAQGSGSERYGVGETWTAVGQDKDGFPVPKGSLGDVTTLPPATEGLTPSGGETVHPIQTAVVEDNHEETFEGATGEEADIAQTGRLHGQDPEPTFQE